MIKPNLKILPSKLPLLVTENPSVGSVTVLILVAAGSRYEKKDTNGLAHFTEHMFFKGTKKRPTALDIASLIDGIGGEFNAFTSKEFTGYFVKAAADHLPLVVDVISDMLLNSKFDPEEIEREKGVVSEELRMYLDTPTRHVADVFEELLYGDHPLGWDTLGTLESLKKIKRDDFLSFSDRFYRPKNMVVSIAGGIKASDAERLVKEHLGDIIDKEKESFLQFIEKQSAPAVKISYKDTEQSHFCLGVRAYPRGHKNHYTMVVLNAIMGTSMSSRLFIQVRERRGLAYYVRSGVDEYYDVGYFAAQAGVPPQKIEEAVNVLLSELAKLRDESVGEEELTKAKENVKGKLVLELEDSREVATTFGLQQLLEGKIRTPEEIMEKLDAVTADDIKKAASAIFENNRLNMAVIGPYKDEEKFVKILKI